MSPSESTALPSSPPKCQVCLHPTCSRHYGAMCCKGCKIFFWRTTRFSKNYNCYYDHKCDVTETRTQCKACRYAKCLKVGMNPGLVREDNKANTQKKHSRWKKLPPSEIDIKTSLATTKLIVIKQENYWDEIFDTVIDSDKPQTSHFVQKIIDTIDIDQKVLTLVNNCQHFTRDTNLALGSLNIVPHYNASDFLSVVKYFVLIERLCDMYTDFKYSHFSKEFEQKCSVDVSKSIAILEPKRISYRSPLNWEAEFYVKSEQIRRVWCRNTAVYFDWASHIPEIKELDLRDRELLLIHRCSIVNWIMHGFKSASRSINGVVFNGGSYFPADKKEWKYLDKDLLVYGNLILCMMDEFVNPARKLKLTEAEYTLLRVICLLAPVPGLSLAAQKIITMARSRCVEVLSELIDKTYPNMNFSDKVDRMSKLMALTVSAEKAGEIEDDFMNFMQLFNISQIRGTLPFDIHIRKYNPAFEFAT